MQNNLIYKEGKIKANALKLVNFSFLFLVFIFLISFSSASLQLGLDGSSTEIGINFHPEETTSSSNSTDYWNTLSLGSLNDANSTQHINVGGVLTINETWLSTFTGGGEPLWNGNYSDFLTVKAWNDTGLIKDWNSTGLILNWSFVNTNTNAETICSAEEVLLGNGTCYDSSGFGGGSSVTIGTSTQIPVSNSGGTDFDYSDSFIYSGGKLDLGNIFMSDFSTDTPYITYSFDDDYSPFSDNPDFDGEGYQNIKSLNGEIKVLDTTPASANIGNQIYIELPAIENYKVSVNETLSWVANLPAYGIVIARWQDNNNYYYFRYRILREASGGGDYDLFLVKNGVSYNLATLDDGIGHPDPGNKTVIVGIQVNGTDISGWVDGVNVISATDGNITDRGRAGFGVGDSASYISNGFFRLDDFDVSLIENIGYVGTDTENFWFSVWNNELLQQFMEGAVKYLGTKIIMEDSRGITKTEIYQDTDDTLKIDGVATRFEERFYVGDNNRLIFRSFGNQTPLYRYEFDGDSDPFGNSPSWTQLEAGTDYFYESDGKLTWDSIYGTQKKSLFVYTPTPLTENYSVQADIVSTFNGPYESYLSVIARLQDVNNYYSCEYVMDRNADGGPHYYARAKVGGTEYIKDTYDPGSEQQYKLSVIKIGVVGDTISCYLNGDVVLSFTDSNFTNVGKTGIRGKIDNYNQYVGSFDDFEVYTENANDYAYFGTTTPNDLAIFVGNQEHWRFDKDTGDFIGQRGEKIILNVNKSEIYSDANLNFITNTSQNPEGIAWFSSNVSATAFITRSKVYDKKDGKALDKIKDSDEWKKEGKVDKIKHYAYTAFEITDYSKPSTCEDKNNNSYICYLETKFADGLDMEERIVTLEQSIVELKIINKDLFKRIEILEKKK